jgi:hypothetical protein
LWTLASASPPRQTAAAINAAVNFMVEEKETTDYEYVVFKKRWNERAMLEGWLLF